MIETILIVDDDDDIRMISRMSLKKIAGWKILEADSGKAALQMLKEHKPDAILLDVMMPDMDGPTTLKSIKTTPELASIPVIFLTAKVRNDEVDQYENLGAAGVIQKPFDPVTLAQEIENCLSA